MKNHGRSFTPFSSADRIRAVNEHGVRRDGDYVLYWMVAARRPSHNFALDRAVTWSCELGKPLLILEALRVDYPWASDRLHRFVIDGMAANQRAFSRGPATYYCYVEPEAGAGRDLLKHLSQSACVVVTDDFPCFFLPHAVASAGRQIDVALEAVDSNGIIPLSAPDRAFTAAVHYRRFMQKHLRAHLRTWPSAHPFAGARLERLRALPAGLRSRWPPASKLLLDGNPSALSRLPIDHTVPVVMMRGGFEAARTALRTFISRRLATYHDAHNHPDDAGTSRLSPYLHFGHLSAHEIFDAVMKRDGWSVGKLSPKATAKREGWWGVSAGAEAFLEQLLVWRELAFNTCAKRPNDYDRYDSLPDWAIKTLGEHCRDPRPHRYTKRQFESAATHDPVWNAAQREMLRDGWFHNYMRMLWGKKILEWSASPPEALATMIDIMNRWSLDGRDPNSYAGYMWTLGRYDRPWPERPIYGTVRSMSSDNTIKKVRARRYLERFST